MLVVSDINTSWRRLPFEALGASVDVLGLAPMDPLVALRSRRWPFYNVQSSARGRMIPVPVLMPLGWARASKASCHRLIRAAQEALVKSDSSISGVVVTSPHYGAMLEICADRCPVYYYCSDDYGAYTGWGGERIVDSERALVRGARHSFFVSRVLAERAINNYGVSSECVSISPNATSSEFLDRVDPTVIDDLFVRFPRLRRPVVGVIGGINGRLDFELLSKCANLSEVGTLLMIGPVDRNFKAVGWETVRNHPQCLLVGARPHEELHAWMQLLDVALIPYRDTPLNQACSPMRLFDHLASGRPIVATAACKQVTEFFDCVHVGQTAEEVLQFVRISCRAEFDEAKTDLRRELSRRHTWQRRAAELYKHTCL